MRCKCDIVQSQFWQQFEKLISFFNKFILTNIVTLIDIRLKITFIEHCDIAIAMVAINTDAVRGKEFVI